MPDILIVIQYTISFLLIALASKQIGKFFSQYGLPYITGYLLAGMLAGPFLLGFLPSGATDQLRFIDDVSLAVIAFVAGSELYLKELRDRMRAILLNTAGIVVSGFLLIGGAIFLMTYLVSFMQDFSMTARIAAALLGATILLALSPASTIAVIQEVRAKGPFTKTVLSITVVMDVVIIVLFAITAAIASTLLEGNTLDPSFVVWLAIDLIVAGLLGLATGKILEFVLARSWNHMLKIMIVLTVGAAVFAGSLWIDNLKLGIHLEPLLTAMIAGFFVTNFTGFRDEFEDILHEVSPYVYVAFFTLTGVALKLDILLATGLIAGSLFLVRMFGIFVGTYAGGTIAGENSKFRRLAWAGLITQAGIALGLAREVAVEFPDLLGDSFATLIISVVVLNEIFGPLFLKTSLRRAGESREARKHMDEDQVRDAIILGVEGQSIALARQLLANDWQVIMADTDDARISQIETDQIKAKRIDRVSEDTMNGLISSRTDALVAMLEDDDANLLACELALQAGVTRLIARPADLSRTEDYNALNARVCDPASAMVAALDQFVRVPQTATLLAHKDPQYDIDQITVTERSVDGVLVRDLRLPTDVLILEITRKGQSVVPHGHTPVHCHDDVTVVGKPESLLEVRRRFGY